MSSLLLLPKEVPRGCVGCVAVSGRGTVRPGGRQWRGKPLRLRRIEKSFWNDSRHGRRAVDQLWRYDRTFVMDKPFHNTPRGRLRGFYNWLTGVAPAPPPSPATSDVSSENLPARIGRYVITRKLGEGGMGVVYAARDERLERTVAVKAMSSVGNDETARKRFWREARAAASVNHPNVCQIYEIGEDRGKLFIAMEMLEGEALAESLRRGPM